MARPPAPVSPPYPPAETLAVRSLNPRWIVSPAAVVIWMAVNGIFLWMGLTQVPLAAAYPSGSVLLVDLILACQIGCAALLAPLLSRSVATMIVVGASNWPILLLAGGLASRPMTGVLFAGFVTTAWLLTLHFWTSCFRSSAQQQIVVAVASLLSIGCPLVSYLINEFGTNDARPAFEAAAAWTPMVLAWNYAADAESSLANALPLTLCLLLGLAIWLTRRCSAGGE